MEPRVESVNLAFCDIVVPFRCLAGVFRPCIAVIESSEFGKTPKKVDFG
jgi:hypothetical protein